MSKHTIYNSRDLRYKTPYGAVSSGTQVQFTLRPDRSEGFSRGQLIAVFEFQNGRDEHIDMPWTGCEQDTDEFSCKLDTSGYTGLIWYSFRLERIDGRHCTLGPYQLTVYDGSDSVPDWFGEGMCYQIFPDRFFRTEIPDPTGMVGGRSVHQDWNEAPLYKPVGKTDRGTDICNRDFFGGNLKGVEEKLDYIASLGVETIYFCPIFEASENHRYGTADYAQIDPMLGSNQDFEELCTAAHKRGIKIMLDGVFNHTGYVSRYFNGDGFYSTPGASQSQDSPYYNWFQWKCWPNDYESWWGIYSLPAVNENCQAYRDFIFSSEHSVVRRWLRAGADAWRLDVADELPDDFVHGIHEAARKENPNAIVIGEVWEDGSTKVAYGVRRKHLLGNHLDGLMNYPFRNALIGFLQGGDGRQFKNAMEQLRENYPPSAFYSAMNALGTHDTLRILTLLGVGSEKREYSKDWRSAYVMSEAEYQRGLARLRLGIAVLFTFPGSPMVYYGDEAGMTGFEDPFNRQTYPWGHENKELLELFSFYGILRKNSQPMRRGDLRWGDCTERAISFTRNDHEQSVATLVNGSDRACVLSVPWKHSAGRVIGSARAHLAVNGILRVRVPAMTAIVLENLTLR